jgi:hypothetical protein
MATIALTASATIMRAARGMGRRYARGSASHGVPYLGFRGHGTDPQPSLPRCVLRSEPAAVRFKGQSQAIGGRRFDTGRPRSSQA